MRFKNEALDEFVEIYRDEFGEELTKTDASEIASRLVAIYETLSKRMPGDPITPLDDQQKSRIGFRA